MKKANLLRLLLILCGAFSCCKARKRFSSAQPDYDDATDTDEGLTPKPGGLGKYFVYVNCTTCKIKSELVVKSCESGTCENENASLSPTSDGLNNIAEPLKTTRDDISDCILDCIIICITNCIKFRTTRNTRPGEIYQTTEVSDIGSKRPGCPPPRPPGIIPDIEWPEMKTSACEDVTSSLSLDYEVSSEPPYYKIPSEPSDYETSSEPSDYETASEPPDYEIASEPSDYDISSEPSDYETASEPSDYKTAPEPPDYETAAEPPDDEIFYPNTPPSLPWTVDMIPDECIGGICVTDYIDVGVIVDKITWFVTQVFTECSSTEAGPKY